MYWLNRLRGTHSWWAKVNALILGVAFGLLTQDYRIGLAVFIGYILGESMGWGDWIGQIVDGRNECGTEGENNGIKWLASKVYPCGSYKYNVLALAIRGFYWWFLTLMSLMLYITPIYVLLGILILALGFPASVVYATTKLSGKPAWNLAEYYYGGIQDIVLFSLIGYYFL